MKLSYCLYSPHSLFQFLFACCVFQCVALTATVKAATLADVPGCACQADTTCGPEDGYKREIGACSFVRGFGNVQNAPIPICDGLEADSEFQETIGDQSNTYSTKFGPYYETGLLSYRMDFGTCDDLYHAQPQKSWCPTSDVQNVTDDEYASELDTDFEWASLSSGAFNPKFGSGGGSSRSLHMGSHEIKTVLQFHYLCESSSTSDHASAITAGYEDNLFLIVSTGPEVNPDDDYEWAPEVDDSRPTLTNKDWIKPIAGSSRRYMTHDFMDVDNGRKYCLLVTAIGNEHCSGPPPSTSMPDPLPDPFPAPPSSSTNGNFQHAGMLLISSVAGTFVFIILVTS